MSVITYKELVFDKEQIKTLYLDNGWYAYTNDIERLYEGIKNSTDTIGAYDGDQLVGFIRTVSDKKTIVYIQDILILSSHHRKGIGKELMNMIFTKYHDVRQIVLMTDLEDERSNAFYKSIGMKDYESYKAIGYSFKPEQ